MDDSVDDVVATRLLPDTTILPGFWRIDGYTRIASMLKSRLGLAEGQNYFEFPYDWRRDNRVAARRLSECVPAWLDNHRRETGTRDAKVWFLGHSMGGLVARYYIEKLGGREFTRGLVTFGTPFRGSMNALDVLVNGFRQDLGPISTVDLTAMVRSFTSVYQLLPTYTCIDDGTGALKHLTDNLVSIPNLDAAKVAAARAFYREMDDAAAAAKNAGTGTRIFPFVGFHQVTSLSARPIASGATLLATLGGQDFQGDSTVPRLSATPDEWANSGVERYATERHASLQNAPEVLQQLEGILSDADVGPFRIWAKQTSNPNRYRFGLGVSERLGLSLEVGDVISVGDLLPIACRPVSSTFSRNGGREPPPDAIDLIAYVVHVESSRTVVVALARSDDGWHRGNARVAEPGAYRVTVMGGAGVTPVSDVFAACDVPGTTRSAALVEGLVDWSRVEAVLEARGAVSAAAAAVANLARGAGVVVRADGRHYALRVEELPFGGRNRDAQLSLHEALDLHEYEESLVVHDRAAAPLRAAPAPLSKAWGNRWVVLEDGMPKSIGEARPPRPPDVGGVFRGEARVTEAESIAHHSVERLPKVTLRGALAPEESISVDVDLVVAPAPDTLGLLRFRLGERNEIAVVARFVPPPELLVRAGDDVRTILVRRDGPGIFCSFAAKVAPDAVAGKEIAVSVSFWVEGGYVGAAQAFFRVAARPATGSPPALGLSPAAAETVVEPTSLRGAVDVSPNEMAPPMLTVQIVRPDPSKPGELLWMVSVREPVRDLPLRMSGTCRITAPSEYVRTLAKGAAPSRATHLAYFRGVGSELWAAAPECFRQTYAALFAEKRENFEIQFISDDPYVPWELMWPDTVDGAGLLAMKHPVARWFLDYQTLLTTQLPRGQILTIAPDYTRSGAMSPLPSAQIESEHLRTQYGAKQVTPTRKEVLGLFETLPSTPVSFLHFAGHGCFLGGAEGSQVYLEDDPLASVEVRAGNNRMAEKGRTLVFFNACETAGSADSLASAAGWAEAFVRRKYGGMIAPLWPVYDGHALRVLDEVALGAINKKQPVANVLRDIRERYAADSPTYLAYIFVGDVRARFA
ncbi:CHAT domain-containing protein [Pendulispora brunnea]|uniref:CHAT domain-containing protein n=1 Tax=Pendulispora brunnea TaxID=2905690 RepID=A0ABZ2K6N7_9BACT